MLPWFVAAQRIKLEIWAADHHEKNSEMFAQVAEAGEYQQAARAAAHFFMFERPGRGVRNEHRV